MSLILDLIILLIFITSILVSYKKGFVKSIYNIIVLIAAIILTKFIQPLISSMLINSGIINRIISTLAYKINVKNLSETNIESFLQNLQIPDFITNFLLNNKNFNLLGNVENLFIKLITAILSFILTFIIVSIILRVLLIIFNFSVSLPLISSVNKILGGLLGFIETLFTIWLVLIIISIIDYQLVKEFIDNTTITKILYNNNYLLIFILSFFSSFTL